MKKLNLIWIALVVIAFVACNPEEPTNYTTVTFEDVMLVDGKLNSADFTSNGVSFSNNYDATYSSWDGFACSSLTDKETAGYLNDLSVYGSGGANGSKQFGVIHYASYVGASECSFADGQAHAIKSLMINNGTYGYLSMRNGDNIAKKFEAGDWFKVTVAGYNQERKTAEVEFYLADFRNGNTYLCADWTKIDLSPLGSVTKLAFSLSSSDVGDWGMNTPSYACIDNLVYE